jgi:hypothetical protein
MIKSISASFSISEKLSFQSKKASMPSSVNEKTRSHYQESSSFEVSLNSKSREIRFSKKYDVTNMSDRQMKEMAMELKDNNLISEWEYASMTLVIKPIGGNYDPELPKNFLSQYQSQTEFAKAYSSVDDTKMLEHLTNLLLEIHETRA